MPRRGRIVDAETLLRKRQLRAEIARSREATRATLASLGQEKRRLTSWRTYVQRFPSAALAVSFAAGLALAAARPGRRLPKVVAASLMQWGVASARSGLWRELLSLWEAGRGPQDGPDRM